MLSLAEGTCRYLDLERYDRILIQVDTWIKLLEGNGDLRDIDHLLNQKKKMKIWLQISGCGKLLNCF